eukprot:TRINITY_DN10663_c1_g1_i9.p1 TRINITY_DN10663_c1_g1~~TRINITY_DN10663_c1_g1_i9.p1  ORF type:complete len:210 (-),score=-16.81 TRINITY_DN10663_c1_g1_i9:505-1098(-)
MVGVKTVEISVNIQIKTVFSKGKTLSKSQETNNLGNILGTSQKSRKRLTQLSGHFNKWLCSQRKLQKIQLEFSISNMNLFLITKVENVFRLQQFRENSNPQIMITNQFNLQHNLTLRIITELVVSKQVKNYLTNIDTYSHIEGANSNCQHRQNQEFKPNHGLCVNTFVQTPIYYQFAQLFGKNSHIYITIVSNVQLC